MDRFTDRQAVDLASRSTLHQPWMPVGVWHCKSVEGTSRTGPATPDLSNDGAVIDGTANSTWFRCGGRVLMLKRVGWTAAAVGAAAILRKRLSEQGLNPVGNQRN